MAKRLYQTLEEEKLNPRSYHYRILKHIYSQKELEWHLWRFLIAISAEEPNALREVDKGIIQRLKGLALDEQTRGVPIEASKDFTELFDFIIKHLRLEQGLSREVGRLIAEFIEKRDKEL